jgi:hypothetical protein
MTKVPAESMSKGIQRSDQRRFRSGKVARVNPGVKKSRRVVKLVKKPSGGFSRKKEKPKEKPKVNFKPKTRLSDRDKRSGGKDLDKFAVNTAAALQFKNVGFPGWETSFPVLLIDKIPMARLLQLMRNQKDFEEFATDEEVLGYVMTATLSGPPSRDIGEIYMYLFNKVIPKEQIPKDLQRVTSLTVSQKSDLRELKRKIRKSQWKDYKSRR